MDESKIPDELFNSQVEIENTTVPFRQWLDIFRTLKQNLVGCYPDKKEQIQKATQQILENYISEYEQNKNITLKTKNRTKKISSVLNTEETDIQQLLVSIQQFIVGQVKEKIFKPFWNSKCTKHSKQLWLPEGVTCTEKLNRIDCPVLRSFLPEISGKPRQPRKPKRQKKTKKKKPPDEDEEDSDEESDEELDEDELNTTTKQTDDQSEPKKLRTVKLRLYPDNRQKNIMMEWIHTRRYLYNKAVEKVRKGEQSKKLINTLTTKYTDPSQMIPCTYVLESGKECGKKHRSWKLGCKKAHRPENAVLVDPRKPNDQVSAWVMDTPQCIRKGAIRDLDKALTECISRIKEGSLKRFQLNFCSRKKTSQPSLEIVQSDKGGAIRIVEGKLSIFPKFKTKSGKRLGTIKLSKRQLRRDEQRLVFDHDCRLKLYNGAWYLMVPATIREKKIQPTRSVCALDPGVRTFQTLYSPEGVVKFQQNMERIDQLHDKIDQLKSLRVTTSDHKTCVRYRRDYLRAYRRLGWLIDELHYSTIHELKQYRHVLLPRFDSQEMVQSRKLDKKTKRRMMALQHYRFRQRLEDYVDINPEFKLYIVNESYTTKTCTRCGILNDVGSNSTYHCLECGLWIDRDVNGARNILLKHLKHI